jgi:hypothetical protein
LPLCQISKFLESSIVNVLDKNRLLPPSAYLKDSKETAGNVDPPQLDAEGGQNRGANVMLKIVGDVLENRCRYVYFCA